MDKLERELLVKLRMENALLKAEKAQALDQAETLKQENFRLKEKIDILIFWNSASLISRARAVFRD